MCPREARYHRGGVGDAFSRIRPEHGSVEPPSSGEGGHDRGFQATSGEPPLTGRCIPPAPAASAPPATPQPRLLDQMREALRSRHYSPRTEQSYCHWVKRFVLFHGARHPSEMAEPQINAFLTYLAVKESVSASTQNQALSALLFLYRHVIGREVGDLGDLIRARRPLRVPVVMTRDEVKAVLAPMSGDRWLMASLMYGAGLRLTECLCLRVQDIDFGRNEITIRAVKGNKDCRTMLPESLKQPLEQHLRAVKRVHEKDLADGWAASWCPMPWTASTPTRPPTGAGNGSSPGHIDGATPRPASRAAITSTKLSSSGRCGTRSLAPD
jgi:integrase